MIEWFFSGAGGVIVGALLTWMLNQRRERSVSVPPTMHQNVPMENGGDVSEPNATYQQGTDIDPTIKTVLNRFKETWRIHGVGVAQIPSLVPPSVDLGLYDIRNDDALLRKLDDQILNWTSEFFDIRKSWLQGESNTIYDVRRYYKDVEGFFSFIHQIADSYTYSRDIEVFALRSVKELDNQGDRSQLVSLVLSIPVATLGSTAVHKYIITDAWDWGYWKSRYQLKAIIRLLVDEYLVYLRGYHVNHKVLEKLVAGETFPQSVLSPKKQYSWYPEDFVQSSIESIQAKELDERSTLLQYMAEQRYAEFVDELKKQS